MKRYPKYKDSGIDWLGEIPEHWKSKRAKYFFCEIDKRSERGDEELLSVSHITGVTPRSEKNITMFMAESYEGYKTCIPHDLVINIMWAWMGALGVSKYKGIISSAYGVYRQKHQNIFNSDYLDYLVRMPEYIAEYTRKSKGIRSSRLRMYSDDFFQIPILCPPLSEQKTIACFIDRKLVQIDQFIRNKQRFIELLKEQKSAIVNRAVTKGLNPDAPMKPSGIEWLGDIPQGWNLRKISHLCRVVRGGSPRPAGDPKFFGGDYCPWITVGEITKDENKLLEFVSEYLTFEGCKHSRYLSQGTLVLTNSGATLGVPKILKISGCINDGSVAFFNLKEGVIYKDYLYYYFRSLTHNYRERIKQGSGQPNLNTDIIKTTPIPLGDIDEQCAIVKHIETESAKIDLAITKAKQEIELIQEYRTTLISDAVTGKIDVRETSTFT